MSRADEAATFDGYPDGVTTPFDADATAGPRRATVLVVEDDASVRELLALHLKRSGFGVLEASSSSDGWRVLDRSDVVILDRGLPDESGDAFLRRLRDTPATAATPVLMLTARASEVDRVSGLEAGADDYLVKPFSTPELVARLRALLRRAPPRTERRFGDLVIDVEGAQVLRSGEPVELTRREYDLLHFLSAHPGRVFDRQDVLDRVWGPDFVGGERTVDQHVAQLRQRFGDGLIETVRGRGYRWPRTAADD